MTISEFLSLSGEGTRIDNNSLLSKLLPVPDGFEFLGAIKKNYTTFTETSILYLLPKTGKLGKHLIDLGDLVSRFPIGDDMDFGIQELDPSRPDGYYILFYLLEENERLNQATIDYD